MPKYLLQVNYTVDGAKGLLEDGGSPRRSAAQQAAEPVGGRIESFDFAFGDTDAFVIAEVPDAASAASIALNVAASGGARIRTTVLMTPEEVDQAARKKPQYRPPGQ